jgi:hypothetical protein
MSGSAKAPPSSRVLPHELPASLRDCGLENWIREPLDDAVDRRRRIIMPPAAAVIGTPAASCQGAMLAEARHPDTIFMMGDNPALPKMPERPTLKDFFLLRFGQIPRMHLLQSARVARENGLGEKVIMACLLHDIAIAGLLSANHGYWGAQLVGPYVDAEVAWAIEKHEGLRYFPDESVRYGQEETNTLIRELANCRRPEPRTPGTGRSATARLRHQRNFARHLVSIDRRASARSAARLAASHHAQRVRVQEGLEPTRP